MQRQSANHHRSEEDGGGPLVSYEREVAQGRIAEDAAQLAVAQRLQALYGQLARKKRRLPLPWRAGEPAGSGLYIWGNVGRGKSMLMQMFYDSLPGHAKRRLHFQHFMMETHAGIHAWRKKHAETPRAENPVVAVATRMAKGLNVLCLDEFEVRDVTDAMILAPFFATLVERGVRLVITSNHPPEKLYAEGLQREQFLKFVGFVNARFEVAGLSAREDYRLRQAPALQQIYFCPLGEGAKEFLERTCTLLHCRSRRTTGFDVQGHTLTIGELGNGIAQASFGELCNRALGPADYAVIAENYRTLILTDIPVMLPEKRNEARRFITLIDALYEHKVRLIATAAAAPDALYPKGTGSFEFRRTVSRLIEMQSQRYLASAQPAEVS